MFTRRLHLVGVLALSCASCVAQAGPNTTFTLQQKTAVPGAVLPSGTYNIQIVDHLNDRSVVQITAERKAATTTFLAVSQPGSVSASQDGSVIWSKGLHGQAALRGFHFSSGETVEFVYPKDDAVALASANKEGVVAVDPASEKRPELAKLSPTDLQLVTLWSLTPVKVGPQNVATKGIEAKRYTAPTNTGTQVAVSSTPPVPAVTTGPAVSRNTAPAPQPTLEAKLERPQPAAPRPYVKRLPKTASYTALLGACALLALAGAATMRLRSSL